MWRWFPVSEHNEPPLIASTTELKQACLDIANAANAMFDLIDEHGDEGPWNDPVPLTELVDGYVRLTRPLKFKATRRLIALGINPLSLVDTEVGDG
jgi:hypothetical protein